MICSLILVVLFLMTLNPASLVRNVNLALGNLVSHGGNMIPFFLCIAEMKQTGSGVPLPLCNPPPC
jgi:hypothetical protein